MIKYGKIELQPTDGRKSFYSKCFVEVINEHATLYSYNTRICEYNTETHELKKFSAFNHSQTTKRHQKAFFKLYGIEA